MDQGEVPARPGRAGRDLGAAIGVGLFLGALLLGSLYVVRPVFVGLAVVAMALGVWEFANALAARGVRVPLAPVLVGTVAILVATYPGGAEALVVALAFTVLAVAVWRLTDGPDGYLRDVTAGAFTVLYVPFLAGFAVLMVRPEEDGALRVTTFIVVTVCSDVGGYVAGVLFGRHAMAPQISPKKSWEGLTGSVLACVAGGALAVELLLDGPWWAGACLGVATACTATLGDLGESMIKRDLGVKDMGSLLPGHGGMMDRLDSLLTTAPVAWLLLTLLVPPD
ncbi:MAG: phosphatidate cytidylyltransferase [Actinomycetes bacterium]